MDSSPVPKPQTKTRTSLTKCQLEGLVALDLLALLQTVTSDGKLLDAEIHSLKEWLEDHRVSPLPAIQHLISKVEDVLHE